MELFDWPSIRSNLISDAIFLLLTLITVPIVTIKILKWKNRKSLVLKFSHILIEFCDFLSDTHYRDLHLNSEHINIFTKRSRIKEYKFVSICIINVFSPLVYPKIKIVIYEVHEKETVKGSFSILKSELLRLTELRIETEKILSVHSMYLDEKILQRISQLCFEIRKLELTNKNNQNFEDLSLKTGSDMTGVFGLQEMMKIYKTIMELIRDILDKRYFDFEIEKIDR